MLRERRGGEEGEDHGENQEAGIRVCSITLGGEKRSNLVENHPSWPP